MPATLPPLRRLLFLLAATASLGACSLLPTGASPLAADEPLVAYATIGGECPDGDCGFTAEILRDGTVNRTDGLEQTVDPATLARLVEEVEEADYEAILAVPFVGECPTHVDGQEQLYTFHVGPQTVAIRSCTTHVDPSVEPFRTVQGILFGVGG
jgi:hypothetical protein